VLCSWHNSARPLIFPVDHGWQRDRHVSEVGGLGAIRGFLDEYGLLGMTLAGYYFAWKYVVGRLNDVLGIG
jgi:hypothetical protein